ncbi:MAG: Hsp70 family protein, partial [Gammaproteobacteria bacterium]
NVSAKNKATGKQQSIIIKASSGLSDEEVQKMIKDAEAHAEEDRKFHAVITARNAAENLIHSTTRSMTDLGDKLEAGEKSEIESAIAALQEAMKSEDAAAIEEKTKALADASGKMAERVYAQRAEAGQTESAAAGQGDTNTQGEGDVVDAEFEEVKENKK